MQNGDTVEIITQAGHHPSKDWLKFVVTSKAISKIKNWIKTEERRKSIDIGKDVLERELRKFHLKYNEIIKSDMMKKIFDDYSVDAIDDLLAQVGYGKVSARTIVNHFITEPVKDKEESILEKLKKKFSKSASAGVSITGVEDVMVRFSKCCNPLPGDEVIGYITRGRGLSVHTSNCPMVKAIDPERLVEVNWNIKGKETYPVHIRVICKDKKGLLAEVSNAISSIDVNIGYATVDANKPDQSAICDFQLEVHDVRHLNEVVSALKKLKSVIMVERIRGT